MRKKAVIYMLVCMLIAIPVYATEDVAETEIETEDTIVEDTDEKSTEGGLNITDLLDKDAVIDNGELTDEEKAAIIASLDAQLEQILEDQANATTAVYDDDTSTGFEGNFDPADRGGGADYIDGISVYGDSVEITNGSSLVTFIAAVDPEITADTVFVECMNLDTYRTYGFNIHRINNFVVHAEVPAGKYVITAGGVKNDYTSQYPIETKRFELIPNQNTVIDFQIGENGANPYLKNNKVTVSLNDGEDEEIISTETASTEESETETTTEDDNSLHMSAKKDGSVLWALAKMVGTILLVAVGVYYWKKHRKKEED